MPFEKGKSGNPGGRPKGYKDVVDLARKEGPASIKKLAYLRDNAETEAVQKAAADSLLDRGFGKPTQSTEIRGDGGGPVQVVISSTDAGLL